MSALTTLPFRGPPKRAEQPQSLEPLLSKKQVAAILGCHERSVERLVSAGRLPVVHVGAKCRIEPRDVRNFIEASKTTASVAAET